MFPQTNILQLICFFSSMLWRFYRADVNITNGAENLTEITGHTVAEDTYQRNKVLFISKRLYKNTFNLD